MPLGPEDRKFATDAFNASLTLMSILIAVITLLAAEYKRLQDDLPLAKGIQRAVNGTTAASIAAGAIALWALIQLRLDKGSTIPLAWALGALIVSMMVGIVCIGQAVMR